LNAVAMELYSLLYNKFLNQVGQHQSTQVHQRFAPKCSLCLSCLQRES